MTYRHACTYIIILLKASSLSCTCVLVYFCCCYLPLDLEHVRQQCSFYAHLFHNNAIRDAMLIYETTLYLRVFNAAQSLFTCLVSLHIHPIPIAHACVYTQWKQSSQYRFAPLTVRKERWFAVCWNAFLLLLLLSLLITTFNTHYFLVNPPLPQLVRLASCVNVRVCVALKSVFSCLHVS